MAERPEIPPRDILQRLHPQTAPDVKEELVAYLKRYNRGMTVSFEDKDDQFHFNPEIARFWSTYIDSERSFVRNSSTAQVDINFDPSIVSPAAMKTLVDFWYTSGYETKGKSEEIIEQERIAAEYLAVDSLLYLITLNSIPAQETIYTRTTIPGVVTLTIDLASKIFIDGNMCLFIKTSKSECKPQHRRRYNGEFTSQNSLDLAGRALKCVLSVEYLEHPTLPEKVLMCHVEALVSAAESLEELVILGVEPSQPIYDRIKGLLSDVEKDGKASIRVRGLLPSWDESKVTLEGSVKGRQQGYKLEASRRHDFEKGMARGLG